MSTYVSKKKLNKLNVQDYLATQAIAIKFSCESEAFIFSIT